MRVPRSLQYPGMPNIWWMPIQTRTEMLSTGIRSQLGIKVFGDDLATIEQAAVAIEHALPQVAGTRSAFGAVWLLWALGYNMSVAVWVGLIALAGLDAETGVVMLLYLTLAHRRRQAEGRLRSFADLREAIVEGAANRIRPKMMTVMTMTLGLLPVLWSSGAGADVMKRIAAPMVGGLVASFVLELTLHPAIFAIWKGRAMAPHVAAPGTGKD